jgi:hypothetical protein
MNASILCDKGVDWLHIGTEDFVHRAKLENVSDELILRGEWGEHIDSGRPLAGLGLWEGDFESSDERITKLLG